MIRLPSLNEFDVRSAISFTIYEMKKRPTTNAASYDLDLESNVPEDERTDEMYARTECFKALHLICVGFFVTTICVWIVFLLFFGTGWLFKLFKEADKAVMWNNS
jgi:hypothetical protein